MQQEACRVPASPVAFACGSTSGAEGKIHVASILTIILLRMPTCQDVLHPICLGEIPMISLKGERVLYLSGSERLSPV